MKWGLGRALVSTSAVLLNKEICPTMSSSFSTCSLIQWYLTSRCLMQLWKAWLPHNNTAAELSQRKGVVRFKPKPSSQSRVQSQTSSWPASVSSIYSILQCMLNRQWFSAFLMTRRWLHCLRKSSIPQQTLFPQHSDHWHSQNCNTQLELESGMTLPVPESFPEFLSGNVLLVWPPASGLFDNSSGNVKVCWPQTWCLTWYQRRHTVQCAQKVLQCLGILDWLWCSTC